MSKPKTNPPTPADPAPAASHADRLLRQGWASVALWMSVGLLLEGLLGYKIPAYLNDPQRRELFRLGHTHGTLLGILLVAAALVLERGAEVPKAARTALRAGAVLVPAGFFIGGIWHSESDPGPAIWLVPVGALLVIYSAIAFTLAHFKKPTPED
jgi:peptidoglycan/LPS O-acetylase OafA/YrhL